MFFFGVFRERETQQRERTNLHKLCGRQRARLKEAGKHSELDRAIQHDPQLCLEVVVAEKLRKINNGMNTITTTNALCRQPPLCDVFKYVRMLHPQRKVQTIYKKRSLLSSRADEFRSLCLESSGKKQKKQYWATAAIFHTAHVVDRASWWWWGSGGYK